MKTDDYISINKNSWNKRTEIHFDSDFYDNKSFINGNSSLNDIELNLLGYIKGKTVLHLQCHFGQDTISLHRMGAEVTGVDFSDKAIDKANELAVETNTEATFVCCDIYDLPKYLNKKFDIIYTSYGTIGWLPDINKWANIVSQFLKPKDKFVFVEFHPVVWMFDDDFSKIKYNYFNTEAIIENTSGTYTDKDADIQQDYISWNHGVGEVVNGLIKKGLTINSLEEYDYSPYNCFNKTIKLGPKKYRIAHLANKIPMVYSIVATKND